MDEKEIVKSINADTKESNSVQTIIGRQRRMLTDNDTGEVLVVDQISKRINGSRNFWKCYLMDFLSILHIFDSRQADVFIYIVENTNQANNLFIGTYRKIAKDVGCSTGTITTIMKKLVEKNFVKRVQNGVWLVNPNILMRGNDTKRQILLSYYQSDDPINQITMSRTKRSEIKEQQVFDEGDDISEYGSEKVITDKK